MPVGLSTASVARFAAGVLAALWAMAGLADDYVTVAAVGASAPLVISIVSNVLLIAGASLAFVHAGGWRSVLVLALALVTIDRIASAALAGAPLQIVSSFIAFVAIAGVAMIGATRRG